MRFFLKVKEKISEVFHPSQTEGAENQPDKRENRNNRHYPNDLDIKIQKDEETKKTKMSQTESESSQSEKKPLLPSFEASTNNNQIQVSDNRNNINDSKKNKLFLFGENR